MRSNTLSNVICMPLYFRFWLFKANVAYDSSSLRELKPSTTISKTESGFLLDPWITLSACSISLFSLPLQCSKLFPLTIPFIVVLLKEHI